MEILEKESQRVVKIISGVSLIVFSSISLIFMLFLPPWDFFTFKFTFEIGRTAGDIIRYINYFLFGIFGYGCFGVPVMAAVLGWELIANGNSLIKLKRIVIPLYGIIQASSLAGIYDLVLGDLAFRSGGWFGMFVIGQVSYLIGTSLTVFSILVLVFLFNLRLVKISIHEAFYLFSAAICRICRIAKILFKRIIGVCNISGNNRQCLVGENKPVIRLEYSYTEAFDPEKTVIDRPAGIDLIKTELEVRVWEKSLD